MQHLSVIYSTFTLYLFAILSRAYGMWGTYIRAIPVRAQFRIQFKECADAARAVESHYDGVLLVLVVGAG
jgi:hypothetical protein